MPMPTSAPAPARRRVLLAGLALVVLVVSFAGLVRGVRAQAQGTGSPEVAQAPTSGAPTSTLLVGTAETPRTAEEELSPLKAVALGVIEGVTEFLPISSTGHLLVSQKLMDVGVSPATKEAGDAYAIVIQAGAILAVAVLYWRRLLSVANGVIGRDAEGRTLGINLLVAFLPAAVLGFAFEKTIKEHLFGPWAIVAAWTAGGLVLLWLSTSGWWEREKHGASIGSITLRTAVIIGLAQCLAMWPGTSRSLVTIVAGLLVGLSIGAAVEFSFLLGLLTLGAATAFDVLKHGKVIVDSFGFASPVIGFVAAFVAAIIAVKWMVGYLQNHSLAIFGWWRLLVAALTVGLLLGGVITT